MRSELILRIWLVGGSELKVSRRRLKSVKSHALTVTLYVHRSGAGRIAGNEQTETGDGKVMAGIGWVKRSWVRRDRENESYCRTCKTWKPKEEFSYRDVERGLLQYDCRQCAQQHRRNSYTNHRETPRLSNDEWTRRAVEAAKEYVYEYLATHPCVDCGNNNVLTLTFDHVRGTKRGTLADMVGRGRSLETIKEEIGKCEVVCFNCHMRREHKRRR